MYTRHLVSLVAAAMLVAPGSSLALPGTHGPSISTWDTRASSVVASGRATVVGGDLLDAYTYSTNFSSTSGNVSSQFGLHYVSYTGQLRMGGPNTDELDHTRVHGLSAGAVTVITRSLGERRANGLPGLAWGMYAGVVPAAYMNGYRNFFTAPLVIGMGLPWSPLDWLTATPWFEVAPSINLDTAIDPYLGDLVLGEASAQTLTQEQVEQILSQAVSLEVGGAVSMRGGMSLATHLGDRWDVNLNLDITHLGDGSDRAVGAGGGVAIVFHWDKVVPAVLH